ncbi:MAG: hypothetical protein J6Q31_05870 [Alistipes sp.]|nr:hypothetical protein [Alistipes sp.]
MKNVFSNLAAFCLGLSVCVAIIACATDSNDYNSNSIEVLSEQIIKLTERVKELEKSSKNVTLPKVVSTTRTEGELGYQDTEVTNYEFDNQGRIIKAVTGQEVTYIKYNGNKCEIKYEEEDYINNRTLTFDADDINNIRAVNNMIVSSIFSEQY